MQTIPLVPDSKYQFTLAKIGKTSLEGNKNGNWLSLANSMAVRNDSQFDAHVTQDVSSGEIVDTQFVDSSKILDRNLILHNYENSGYHNKREAVDHSISGTNMNRNDNKFGFCPLTTQIVHRGSYLL